ncbi:MAG: preprotein translocase subunit SecY [Candidatus Woesearchaeota archaeon]|nr:MAG: preprotein translocase subunit SecY [Candidatus Woesearchaeota archaeon]
MNWEKITSFLPEVRRPTQKRLSFKEKLKWTGLILLIFFVLSEIPLFGLGANALQQFEYLSIILGTKFGSIISLGIGPIVVASIILQLLQGSGILNLDTNTQEGRAKFQALQRIVTIFFIFFEAIVYVFMGGLAPPPELAGTAVYMYLQMFLVAQLFVGGFLIVLMDEVVQKWGFGSGVGLFIAGGVASQIFIRAFNPLPSPQNPAIPSGQIPNLIISLQQGNPTGALIIIIGVVATIVVFLISVYGQPMKVEIPLSFGRVRGMGMRWPLQFMYTSNIPVILISALLANLQLWGRLLQNWGHPFLGEYSGNIPVSGVVKWIQSPEIVRPIISGAFTSSIVSQALVYLLIMMGGSVLFSVLWVKTASMDARAQADRLLSSGLQIPGFRRDPRVLEKILNRYIPGLTIMGAMFVGFLAATADLMGALSRGTGILLTVMIVYRMYQEISKQYAMDMHPALRKILE